MVTVQKPAYSTYPTLHCAAEAAGLVKVVSAERLTELARAGYAPCWWFDDIPWFDVPAVKRWMATEFGKSQPPRAFPRALLIGEYQQPALSAIPLSLHDFHGCIQPVPENMAAWASGVYFLVAGDTVVYIGQSVSVAARISTHRREKTKSFDYALFLPVPESELDAVEGSLIRAIKPPLNGKSAPLPNISSANAYWTKIGTAYRLPDPLHSAS